MQFIALGGSVLDAIQHAVVFASQRNDFEAIRQQFNSLDLLLLDDIHCLRCASRSQAELFHAINTLIKNQKQIVVTSGCLVGEIENMNLQLAGRLGSGMNVKLEQPDVELGLAILHAKAAVENVLLDDDVAMFIAQLGLANVRLLNRI